MRHILGVDGGNTKTDYLLCMEDGSFVDVYRAGSVSHEHYNNSYDGMDVAMRGHLDIILKRNKLDIKDIAAAGFGLAGADITSQVSELHQRVKGMGFTNFALSNDGILGVKAASENGVGVCVVNGTGTVVFGMDIIGKTLQVGGLGELSGDMAGGGFATRALLSKLYAYHFRYGPDSSLFPNLLELFGVKPDELVNIINDYGMMRRRMKDIIQLAAQEAQNGDPVAKSVFDEMGENTGKSAAGCIRRLQFEEVVEVILVGSIWLKVPYTGMKHIFQKTVEELSGKKTKLKLLNAPPVVGGILWANEILFGKIDPKARKKILETLTLEKYEKLCVSCT